MVAAGIDAFGASLALGRINENSKIAGLSPFLFVNVPILRRAAELPAVMFALRGIGDGFQLGFQFGLRDDLAQDGGVRTLGDTLHATHAVLAIQQGNFGSDIGEIPQHAGAGRDERTQR
jgi:hypothetical protein